MSRLFRYCLVLLSVAAISCSKSDSDAGGDTVAEGTISLSLATTVDSDADIDSSSSSVYGSLADEYAVEIYKDEELYTSWSSFSAMVNPFRLYTGDYTMRIYWGPNQAFAFGMPYYEGSSDFSVIKDEQSEISITASLANTKLKVNFSDRMSELYDDYWLEAATAYMTEDGVTTTAKYAKDNSSTGYFRSAPITAYLMLIAIGGSDTLYYKISEIDAQPQESYTLDIVPSISDAYIDITIDESINNRSETVSVPVSALDYDITITTPTESNSIVTARSQLSLTSAVLNIDKTAAELLSMDDSYEFIGISDDRISEMDSLGIEPIYTSDDTRISIWLTELFAKLPEGSYTFSFVVVDSKPTVNSKQFTVEIK